MKLALLPCVAIAAVVAGCNGDGDGASPTASVRVGAPAVEAASTVSVIASDASVAATETRSDEPTVGRVRDPESTDTTVAPAYLDVDVGPGLGTDGYVGARDDVQLDRCELAGDHWVAAGTVTNTSGAGAAYRIYVAFNPPDSATRRVGSCRSTSSIPEGETQAWEAVAWITDPGLECVLRVERISG